MGIEIFVPYENPVKRITARNFGCFRVTACPMLDRNMEIWQHTNTDGTECPCYAFLIETGELKILYITDAKLCTWDFSGYGLTHMVIGCDYDDEMVSDDEHKREHVLRGHLSTDYVRDNIVGKYKTGSLKGVYLGHMSEENNDKSICVRKVKESAGNSVFVDYAAFGKSWVLTEGSECPF